jgi:hypothetical protein
MQRHSTFDDFFRYYVSQHSKPATRWVHFAATHLGAAIAALALLGRRPRLLALWPVATYLPAFASHWVIEKNQPVTLGGNVPFAMRGDLRMVTMMWSGRDAELGRIAEDELARRQRESAIEVGTELTGARASHGAGRPAAV